MTEYTFDHSKIFPGTVRDYWVYVPKQYDPAKPACVYVNQDGIQFNAPAVFDELIHKKEMPVVIGVFVTPGRVKAPSDQALDRFNRSYEYDGLGDNYARFLLEELLPEVETKKTADGRPIRLSKDGNDRCIAGSSSGAICAFTAAWERPDAFRRVFSSIGTYVGLRGGNVYPTLIRKYEPKPIRIFLQDGSTDLNIYGGDWWMANQEMERALIFAGYEVNHDWGNGGHNGKHATRDLPRRHAMALERLAGAREGRGRARSSSRRSSCPARAGRSSPMGTSSPRGRPSMPRARSSSTTSPTARRTRSAWTARSAPWLAETKHANGQAFGPDGRIYAVARGQGPRVRRRRQAHGDRRGHPRQRPGRQPRRRDLRDQPELRRPEPSKVWYISPKGEKRVVDSGLRFPNGITLSPDQSLLYVADYRSHWVYSYQVQPDGSLAYKQKYFHLHVPDTADESGADGMRVDRDGRLYVTTAMGIQVCDQPGRVNCIIPTPNGRIANLCFGGPDFDTIFATCGDRVYKRKVKVKGANAYQAPIKPPTPRL